MIKAFNKLFVEGGQSAVTDALYLAVQLMVERERQAKNERKAIILITDAEDRESYYNLKDVADLLRNSDVQIFILAWTNDLSDNGMRKNSKTNAENFARQISVESSGIAYIFGNAITDENIQEVLKSIMVELRSPYIVGYSPIDRNPEMPRKLAISVTDGQQGEKRNAVASENKILLID